MCVCHLEGFCQAEWKINFMTETQKETFCSAGQQKVGTLLNAFTW